MESLIGRCEVRSSGGTLTPGVSLDIGLRSRLFLAGVLACVAGLTLAILPAMTAPSTGPPARGHSTTPMPLSLVPAASRSIGASERRFWPVGHGDGLLARGGPITATFTASGAALGVGGQTLDLSLTGVGDPQRLKPMAAVAPTHDHDQVRYDHGSISESYVNGPYGVEQGFTVSSPQTASQTLVLDVGIGGSLKAHRHGSQILFTRRSGATALRYGQLHATDATGRPLPAHLRLHHGSLELDIDTRGASYPLRIDPFIQQGKALTGRGESEYGTFGWTVALSADGGTALIGAPFDNHYAGAAWVFTRSGTTWTQQGGELTGGGEIGAGEFGYSVALSAEGDTALVGGRYDNNGAGAAWAFTRSGKTWTQQGEKLTPSGEVGAGYVGFTVALSADGDTALIGGPYDNGEAGAAWVFTRSGETWTQQGEGLAGSGETNRDYFGDSVALSGDGDTALIGGYRYDHEAGAAWVFTRSGETWTQQGERLTGSGESARDCFGWTVALSSEGDTALIGDNGDGGDTTEEGAAWVFTRSGETWTQQGERLTGSGESVEDRFGYSVALSGDGDTALIGGFGDNGHAGAAWVFERSATSGAWIQQGEKLTGSGEVGEGEFGDSVALSGDGDTALIGGDGDSGDEGAGWVFAQTSQPTAALGASVKIEKVRMTATSLVVTATTSQRGTVTISAPGLRRTVRTVAAGTHELRVALTTTGKVERTHARKIKLAIRLEVADKTVSSSREIRL